MFIQQYYRNGEAFFWIANTKEHPVLVDISTESPIPTVGWTVPARSVCHLSSAKLPERLGWRLDGEPWGSSGERRPPPSKSGLLMTQLFDGHGPMPVTVELDRLRYRRGESITFRIQVDAGSGTLAFRRDLDDSCLRTLPPTRVESTTLPVEILADEILVDTENPLRAVTTHLVTVVAEIPPDFPNGIALLSAAQWRKAKGRPAIWCGVLIGSGDNEADCREIPVPASLVFERYDAIFSGAILALEPRNKIADGSLFDVGGRFPVELTVEVRNSWKGAIDRIVPMRAWVSSWEAQRFRRPYRNTGRHWLDPGELRTFFVIETPDGWLYRGNAPADALAAFPHRTLR